MSENDESRANRLRNRRKRTRDRASEQDETDGADKMDELSESDETDKPSKPSQPSQTSKSDAGRGTGVKDEQVGTYMYLPESVRDDLAYQFKIQSAEFEREFGEKMEKNRHWYPLVIELGLEQIEGMDPKAIHDRLQHPEEDE